MYKSSQKIVSTVLAVQLCSFTLHAAPGPFQKPVAWLATLAAFVGTAFSGQASQASSALEAPKHSSISYEPSSYFAQESDFDKKIKSTMEITGDEFSQWNATDLSTQDKFRRVMDGTIQEEFLRKHLSVSFQGESFRPTFHQKDDKIFIHLVDQSGSEATDSLQIAEIKGKLTGQVVIPFPEQEGLFAAALISKDRIVYRKFQIEESNTLSLKPVEESKEFSILSSDKQDFFGGEDSVSLEEFSVDGHQVSTRIFKEDGKVHAEVSCEEEVKKFVLSEKGEEFVRADVTAPQNSGMPFGLSWSIKDRNGKQVLQSKTFEFTQEETGFAVAEKNGVLSRRILLEDSSNSTLLQTLCGIAMIGTILDAIASTGGYISGEPNHCCIRTLLIAGTVFELYGTIVGIVSCAKNGSSDSFGIATTIVTGSILLIKASGCICALCLLPDANMEPYDPVYCVTSNTQSQSQLKKQFANGIGNRPVYVSAYEITFKWERDKLIANVEDTTDEGDGTKVYQVKLQPGFSVDRFMQLVEDRKEYEQLEVSPEDQIVWVGNARI